jgi:protein-S-isoprenylcysteine O-methyltransferase Ste14
MTFLELSALAYWLLYYGLLLIFRAYILYRNTGVNAIKNIDRTGLRGFVERVFQACFILIPVLVLNYVFIPLNYVYFVPIDYLMIYWLNAIGVGLGLGGILFAFIAQLQMGDAWRLGIDRDSTTEVVAHGLYRYSRNPIYLGVLVATLGFFLMLPSAASFGLFVANYLGLEVKIRLEEEFLVAERGEPYARYLERVRRWL